MSSTITGLTDSPNQIQPVLLPDGSTLTMTLVYRPQQAGWFVDLSWDGQTPNWVNQGLRLTTSPNWLRQYKNQLPFGIGVHTTDLQDPAGQEDFASGYCQLILLDAADVVGVEEVYFAGN